MADSYGLSRLSLEGMRMNVRRTSWHYRLLRFLYFDPHDNLCPYVRQVFGALVMASSLAMVALIVLFVAAYPIWRPVLGPDGWAGFFSAIAWLGAGWFSIAMYRAEWQISTAYAMRGEDGGMLDVSKWYHRDLIPEFLKGYRISIPKPKHDSIILERARAAHDMICPSLTFKE